MRTVHIIPAVVAAAIFLGAGAACVASPSSPVDPAVARLSTLHGHAFDVAYLQTVIPIEDESVEMAMTATLYADHPALLHWNQDFAERERGRTHHMVSMLEALGGQPSQRNEGVATTPVKKLRALRGPALERMYIGVLTGHLDRVVLMSKLAAQRADRADLRELAAGTATAATRDGATLRAWLAVWYP